MTAQMRKEVSLDSQGQGLGGSLANSRLTISSRETPISLKSVDNVDESIQVDLSADTVTYDSDDEMVKRRSGIPRNKKGHPIYSREDIREQYCITKKEEEVLESKHSIRFFGCLQQNSPCTKDSVLFSCVQKRRSSSEENLPQIFRNGKTRSSKKEEDADTKDSSEASVEDEFVKSGFRQRPKCFCLVDPKQRFSFGEGDTPDSITSTEHWDKTKLDSTASLGDASQLSYDSDRSSGRRRPSHLALGGHFQPSHSVDELNDRRKEDTHEIFGVVVRRAVKTPDVSLDDRRPKHVSFDSTSLVRSNTVGGGLEEVDPGPVATSTPLNTQRKGFSGLPRNRSHERLLDKHPNYEMLERTLGDSSSISSVLRGTVHYRPRRSITKTQATQTELSFKGRFTIPAYLTLSPRATSHCRRHTKPSSHRTAPRLTKSRSSHGVPASEESDDEVLEVDLVSKRQRFVRSSSAKSASAEPKQQQQEEIMLTFKPTTPPVGRNEVLIGERLNKRISAALRSMDDQRIKASSKTSAGPTTEAAMDMKSEAGLPRTSDTAVRRKGNRMIRHYFSDSHIELNRLNIEIFLERKFISLRGYPSCGQFTSISSKVEVSEHGKGLKEEDSRDKVTLKSSTDDSDKATTKVPKSKADVNGASAEKRRREYLKLSRQIKYSKSHGTSVSGDMLTSPDSESSSSHFTERESSQSEISTESSARVKSASSRSVTEDEISESSEYVTATEHSHPEKSGRSGTKTENGHTSFESASSISLFSSPSSHAKSSSLSTDGAIAVETAFVSQDKDDKRDSPQKTDNTMAILSEDNVESSDESTKKEFSSNSDLDQLSPIRSRSSEKTDADIGGDSTPVFDHSPEASSMQDAETVIEVRSEGTSEEFLESMNESMEAKEPEEEDDDIVFESVPLSEENSRIPLYMSMDKRTSDELSTVSEVSEESSQGEAVSSWSGGHDNNQHSEEDHAEAGKSSSSEYISSETTTPSFDSTTSGSFVPDNMSYVGKLSYTSLTEEIMASGGSMEFNDHPRSRSTTAFESSELERESYPMHEEETPEFVKGRMSVLGTYKTVESVKPYSQDELANQAASSSRFVKSSEGTSKDTSAGDKSSSSEKETRERELRLLCSQCGEELKDSTGKEKPYYKPLWDSGEHSQMPWRIDRTDRNIAEIMNKSHLRYGLLGETRGGAMMESDMFLEEDEDSGVHAESYRASTWIYVSDSDELAVWREPLEKEEVQEDRKEGAAAAASFSRSDSLDSTNSEHDFLKQYQAVTHRMVHRKASVEMYRRIGNKTFEIDKVISIQRNNGEFGFRIHGSKPVVVSAIEKDTSAETCGLEVGDIIISINNISVLEASHSEVVRIAHAGADTLSIAVARTVHVLAPVLPVPVQSPVFSGFLQRLSVSGVTQQKWCRRWFILKHDGCLYWYRTPKDHEPLGAIVLQNQVVSRVSDSGAPHAFKLTKYGGYPRYFSADDEGAANKWISVLTQVASAVSRVDPYMEASLKNVQLPATSVSNCECQGFLSKLSQRWKCWKRRYFVLKDASLYFYMDYTSATATGMFHFHGYKVQSCNIQGKKHAFEAIPPEPRFKHLYFVADSENDKKKWLAALEYSIDRWIMAG